MASYRYRVVDVFTETKLEGNPLAVFPDAAGLDDPTMQKIARELNLSETVFVLAAGREGCLRRLRIFTPAREMRFAGHPTIGTGWVLRDEGVVPTGAEEFLLDLMVGTVPLRVDGPLLWLRTPPISFGPRFDPGVCAKAIGLGTDDLLPFAPQVVTAGNPNVFIAVKDKAAVDRAVVDSLALREIRYTEPVCLFVFTPTATGAYSRMFAPEFGIVEDPATGSATGPLAAFLIEHGLAPTAHGTRMVSEQGVAMGRRSLLHIELHGERGANGIDVGGAVAPLMQGTLEL